MKKILGIVTLLLLLSLAACSEVDENKDNDEVTSIDHLNIYYVNDMHGALLSEGSRMGMAAIGNLLINEKNTNPDNTIILSGGDMLQGSALSNYYQGESTIELMNESLFDAMVIGNHEFDWGLETVTRYFNPGDENFIADFPLLGANVFHKGTKDIPEGIDPYVILNRGQLKIGVIGIMGYGLESSISRQYVEDYEFFEPLNIVKETTAYLRNDENVDMVILLTHDSGYVNQYASEFVDEHKIDAIFNAHSHRVENQYLSGIPTMQSGAYGTHVGYLRLDVNSQSIEDTSMNQLTKLNTPLLTSNHPGIQILLNQYVFETDQIFNEPIIYNSSLLSRNVLTEWMSTLLRESTNADIGFHNSGGTRTDISGNDDITLSTLYDVWPFDNEVVTLYLTGEDIKTLMNNMSGYSTDIHNFIDDELYKVATNDYLYYHENYPFHEGTDVTHTEVYLRDLAARELSLQAIAYGNFDPTNAILSNSVYTENDDEVRTNE
ncbi:MAG: bifunctional metallophosphatase/5'-nucleotidase [Candidatus Izemoplasmataceae bacterium]